MTDTNFAALRGIFYNEAAIRLARIAMHDIRRGNVSVAFGLTQLGDHLCGQFAVSATYIGDALVLRRTMSRAKDPAVIVIRMVQSPHPYASASRTENDALIELFARESDFAGLEGTGPRTPYRKQAQGSMLHQ